MAQKRTSLLNVQDSLSDSASSLMQVAGLFHDASIGNPVHISIVRLIFLEDEEVRRRHYVELLLLVSVGSGPRRRKLRVFILLPPPALFHVPLRWSIVYASSCFFLQQFHCLLRLLVVLAPKSRLQLLES